MCFKAGLHVAQAGLTLSSSHRFLGYSCGSPHSLPVGFLNSNPPFFPSIKVIISIIEKLVVKWLNYYYHCEALGWNPGLWHMPRQCFSSLEMDKAQPLKKSVRAHMRVHACVLWRTGPGAAVSRGCASVTTVSAVCSLQWESSGNGSSVCLLGQLVFKLQFL